MAPPFAALLAFLHRSSIDRRRDRCVAVNRPSSPARNAASGPSAAPRDPADPLRPEQVRQFRQDGFLVLPPVCTALELAAIHGVLDTLFREKAGRSEGSHFDMLGLDTDATEARQPQIIQPSVFAPALLHGPCYERLFAIARQLLGPDTVFSFDHSILKPAHSSAATPWHQDEAHQPRRYCRYPQISVWLPMQDTPENTGCMRYIPASHRGPLLPHRHLNGDARIHGIECEPQHVDALAAVTRPVPAGSCILHDGRTLHGALPNVSAIDRIAYVVAFTGPPLPLGTADASRIKASGAASTRRRNAWLLNGGFVITTRRRIVQGLRGKPRTLLHKWRLALLPLWQRMRRLQAGSRHRKPVTSASRRLSRPASRPAKVDPTRS